MEAEKEKFQIYKKELLDKDEEIEQVMKMGTIYYYYYYYYYYITRY